MNISTPSAPVMSSRKRRQMGKVLTIESPYPTTNIAPVNWRMPIQMPTGISSERISRPVMGEERVRVISEHLQDWQWSFSDLCLAWLQLGASKRQGLKKRRKQRTLLLPF